MNIHSVFCAVISILMMITGSCYANTKEKVSVNTKTYALMLGKGKIIFPLEGKGTNVSVTNLSNFPILVQSRVLTEDMKNKANFIVTPPLFRLDSTKKMSLDIIRTGANFPTDKESLQWLCVKGIPPKGDDAWAKDINYHGDSKEMSLNLNILIDHCIKLFTRPSNLAGMPTDFGGSLIWKINDGELIVNNPTPFYMNLSAIQFNGKAVESEYVPPKSERKLLLPKGSDRSGRVSWKLIDDYGSESQSWSSDIH